jgi:hypothetical protein
MQRSGSKQLTLSLNVAEPNAKIIAEIGKGRIKGVGSLN